MSRSDRETEQKNGYGDRLKEITAVLKKHSITRGISPEKLRLILEDLGPTYIKLGQLMSLRSDILPKRYCDELMKLCSEVPPMPFSEVIEVLEESMGCPWQAEFQQIQEDGAERFDIVHRNVGSACCHKSHTGQNAKDQCKKDLHGQRYLLFFHFDFPSDFTNRFTIFLDTFPIF